MSYPLTNINTALLPQFQNWTDQYGMICNNPNQNGSDNGNLFTAHYTYGVVATNQINEHERQRILQVYSNNFSQVGLLCRSPNFPGNRQAQDDIYGLMGAEALLEPTHRFMTRSIYEYGLKNAEGIDSTEPYQFNQKFYYYLIKLLTLGRCRWVWNNIEPGKFDKASWLGRFPAFLAVMQMSLRESVNPLFWIWWAATSLMSAWFGNKNGNNGDCLMIHAANAAQGYGKITNWVCKQISKGIERKYGSVGGLMAVYFQDPSNPLIVLLNNID